MYFIFNVNVILIQIEIDYYIWFDIIAKLWNCYIQKRGQDWRYVIFVAQMGDPWQRPRP